MVKSSKKLLDLRLVEFRINIGIVDTSGFMMTSFLVLKLWKLYISIAKSMSLIVGPNQ
jgi:hypothetical protein